MSVQILLADHDHFFSQLYGDILTRAGYQVSSITEMGSLLALRQAGLQFDIVLIELAFGQDQWMKLVSELLGQKRAPELVGLMQAGDGHLLQTANRLGITHFLQKPIEGEHLLVVVRELLRNRVAAQETNLLVSENIFQLEMQRVFDEGFVILRTLDDAALYDRLLKAASQYTNCQGTALYVARDTHLELVAFQGLISSKELPEHLGLSSLGLTEAPILARAVPTVDPVQALSSEVLVESEADSSHGLILLLAQDNHAEGVVVCTARTGPAFNARDRLRAELFVTIASVSLANARRFANERHSASQKQVGNTFNMSFFVDYLGKELHKARRYRRPFTIIQIVFDGFATLSSGFGPQHTEKLHQDIVRGLRLSLREADILARAAENEFMILLPETDLFGARITIGRIEQVFAKDPTLVQAQRTTALQLTLGFAVYPYDGNDIEPLMAASRVRISEARKSAYRRLHLSEATFYETAQLLLGPQSPMRDLIDSPTDYGYTELTPPEVVALVREFLLMASGQPNSRAVLYWGVPEINPAVFASIAELMPQLDGTRTFILGARDPLASEAPPGITPVYLEPEQATKVGFVFSLSEHHAYSLLGKNLNVAHSEAFHTSDFSLAVGLARKLQQEYNLQRWF